MKEGRDWKRGRRKIEKGEDRWIEFERERGRGRKLWVNINRERRIWGRESGRERKEGRGFVGGGGEKN